jgi:hypothetical protein
MARFKLDRNAYRAIRTSPLVVAEISRRAHLIAAAADRAADDPGGHFVDSGITGGRGRARSAVITATNKSKAKEAVHRTLTTAFNAGRG